MKITRYKKAQKVLTFYQNNFHFVEPYQVVIDGTFALLALRMKINIKEQIPKYLGAECDIFTTTCCLHETENLGPTLHGALLILKQFVAIKCGHTDKPLPASACLHQICKAGNAEKYFIACQDQELQDKLRKRPAVPLIYLHHQSLTLEKHSEKSEEAAKVLQEEKVTPTSYQKEVLAGLKKSELGIDFADQPVKKRKRRGPKQPNPLSCKKSKKKLEMGQSSKITESEGGVEKKSRKRHKRLKMSDALKGIHHILLTQSQTSDD